MTMVRLRKSLRMKLLVLILLPATFVAMFGSVTSSLILIRESRQAGNTALEAGLGGLRENLARAFFDFKDSLLHESRNRAILFRARSAFELSDDDADLRPDLYLSVIRELQIVARNKGYDQVALYGLSGLVAYATPGSLRIVTRSADGEIVHHAPSSPSAIIRFASPMWKNVVPAQNLPQTLSLPLGPLVEWQVGERGLALQGVAPLRTRILDPDTLQERDEVVGAILFRKTLDDSWLRGVHSTQSVELAVFDASGARVAASASALPTRLAPPADDGTFSATADNTSFLVLAHLFERKTNPIGTIAAFISRDALMGHARAIILFQLAGLGLGFLLAVGISIAAGRSFIRPVTRISRQMSEIADTQDFTRTIDVTSEDELGQLATSFNDMVDRLNGAYRALVRSQEELEERVRERTDDLRDINAALEREIAEHRNTEEALRIAKAAAEEAVRVKSEFLANVSHEIRTPLNAIIGMGHLIRRTQLTDRQRDYLEKIDTASHSLLDIITSILDFSRLEGGIMSVDAVPFDLNDLLRHLGEALARKAQDKPIDVLFDTPPDLPSSLVGDAMKLRQVLDSITDNAIRFTQQGEVVVSIRTLRSDESSVLMEFSVRDTGIGMSQEKAARLFAPFTQGDQTPTRRHGGVGIGLALSRRLVELCGGEMRVDTAPERGTTVTFTIPLLPGATTVRPERLPDTNCPHRALIVDDSPTARLILANLLEDMGLETQQAETATEALASLRKADGGPTPFDIVILDWLMPGMDGIDAARAILDDTTLDNPPHVVLATAFPREALAQRAPDLALDAVLIKPITPTALRDAISELCAHAQPRPPSGAQDALRAPASTHGEHPQAPVVSVETLALPDVLPGVDIALGIRRTAGNREAYRALLARLVSEHATTMNRLRDAIRMGTMGEARRLATSLAVLAENAAAFALHTAATDLTQALRDGRDPKPLLERLEECVKPLGAALTADGQRLQKTARHNAGDDSPDALRLAMIEELLPLLAQRKPTRCRPLLERVEAEDWGAEMAPLAERLVFAARSFRYDEAIRAAHELSQRLLPAEEPPQP
ncbi:signal transduction histidine kinase/CheY-like chemotaxis protein/HPt (histidine-containing phosphotransfer) domain-containing protein [Desulfobaculum xiamenense]|uniref:Sensory/regulatory protein RpfC n=1 Tax=Desulfobaculum xiamenense TaxID=995050 RepID=A0A846QU02_9BACT|nr:ATP-binding protein [Desulfobaculum xiamenense]NJB68119.1 signal transduction histidine kinase/CheY-like chemotaxis protein/HPt (histidine-containing phosphotransfer) domain-containing protein [Desulfobaculum xiamenense]